MRSLLCLFALALTVLVGCSKAPNPAPTKPARCCGCCACGGCPDCDCDPFQQPEQIPVMPRPEREACGCGKK